MFHDDDNDDDKNWHVRFLFSTQTSLKQRSTPSQSVTVPGGWLVSEAEYKLLVHIGISDVEGGPGWAWTLIWTLRHSSSF